LRAQTNIRNRIGKAFSVKYYKYSEMKNTIKNVNEPTKLVEKMKDYVVENAAKIIK